MNSDFMCDQDLHLKIDHDRTSLNPATTRMIRTLVMGLITELKGCKSPADIHLILTHKSPQPIPFSNGSSRSQAVIHSSSWTGGNFLASPSAAPNRRPSSLITRKLSLNVDGKLIPLKPFIENMLFNTVRAVVTTLLHCEDMTTIELRMKPKKRQSSVEPVNK